MKNIITAPINFIIAIIPTTITVVVKLVQLAKGTPSAIQHARDLPWKEMARSATNRQTIALFYRNNKTYILSTGVITVVVFFTVSWTNNYFVERSAKVKTEISLAEKTLSTSMTLLERSKTVAQTQHLLEGGLITYMQNLSQQANLESNQIKITPRTGTNSTEQLNVRLDGLTLYQLTEMLKDIESYDNLAIISINIKPQFNDETKLLITISIAKEIIG